MITMGRMMAVRRRVCSGFSSSPEMSISADGPMVKCHKYEINGSLFWRIVTYLLIVWVRYSRTTIKEAVWNASHKVMSKAMHFFITNCIKVTYELRWHAMPSLCYLWIQKNEDQVIAQQICHVYSLNDIGIRTMHLFMPLSTSWFCEIQLCTTSSFIQEKICLCPTHKPPLHMWLFQGKSQCSKKEHTSKQTAAQPGPHEVTVRDTNIQYSSLCASRVITIRR